MEEIERELKQLIVNTLMLKGVAPESIDSESPLFVDGLGLDSIDALELAMALGKRYGVTIEGDTDDATRVFASVRSLAAFVKGHRKAPEARG